MLCVALSVSLVMAGWLYFWRSLDFEGAFFDYDAFILRREAALLAREPVTFEPRLEGFEFLGRERFFGEVEELLMRFGLRDRLVQFESEDGLMGIMDMVEGKVFVEARYSVINFNRGGVVAVGEFGGRFYVYYRGELVGATDERVSIFGECGWIFAGGNFFNAGAGEDFCFDEPFLIEGFSVFVPPMKENGGVMVVAREQGFDVLLWLKCLVNGLLTDTRFVSLGAMHNGGMMGFLHGDAYFLEVFICEDGGKKIIEHRVRAGIEIFGFNEDGYAVFKDNDSGLFGIIDRNFDTIIEPSFKNLYLKVLTNNLLLCLDTNSFFCFDLKQLTQNACAIYQINGYYVTHNMGFFGLKNKNLENIALKIAYNKFIYRFDFIFYEYQNMIILIENYLFRFKKYG